MGDLGWVEEGLVVVAGGLAESHTREESWLHLHMGTPRLHPAAGVWICDKGLFPSADSPGSQSCRADTISSPLRMSTPAALHVAPLNRQAASRLIPTPPSPPLLSPPTHLAASPPTSPPTYPPIPSNKLVLMKNTSLSLVDLADFASHYHLSSSIRDLMEPWRWQQSI